MRRLKTERGTCWDGDKYALALIPLPLGLGLFASKYQGEPLNLSVRSWEWARFDFYDYSHKADSTRAGRRILSTTPKAYHPFASALDAWQTARFWKRYGA